MGVSIPANVTPSVLEWARLEAGYEDPEPVAKRLGVRPKRLLQWERGELKPTLRQVQTLAKIYHRPLGIFFVPEKPSLPPLAAHYRRLPGIRPGKESPELRVAIRVMCQRREAAMQLSAELGYSLPEFREVARLSESPLDVGERLRSALGVSEQEQQQWRNEWQAWRRWRQAVENIGVLVFQFSKVDLQEVRGVTLPLFPMPVIGVNSKEISPAARSFTLVHELVHLALAFANEERVARDECRPDSDWQKVERFAEEVASALLVPHKMLEESLRQMSVRRDAWDVESVRQLARRFRVTPLAMATRLRTAGQLTWRGHDRWKQAWDAYVAQLPPRRSGFATPAEKTLSQAGRPFAQLVLEALDGNRITAVEACRYLDLRWDHIEKLRVELRVGPGNTREPLDAGD